MIPNLSQWSTTSIYTYVERLSVAGIAWEWLRRNSGYQRDYAAIHHLDSDIMPERLAAKWGLQFPYPSRPIRP